MGWKWINFIILIISIYDHNLFTIIVIKNYEYENECQVLIIFYILF
jgi:hypothetical protein